MDPTKMLEVDHRQVEALFKAIEKAEGDERAPLIEQLETALRAHMELEERIVYPAMARASGEDEVEEGNKEHELARKSLADMVALGPDEPGFGAALEATKAGIAHHVEEEERIVFPQLRSDGTIFEQITSPFIHTRIDLGMPMDAALLATTATKNELLFEARAAGIEGASSMNKVDLAEALAATMAGGS